MCSIPAEVNCGPKVRPPEAGHKERNQRTGVSENKRVAAARAFEKPMAAQSQQSLGERDEC
jgi:hypothetical protein